MRPSRLEIDLTAVRHNVETLATRAAPAEVIAVVKANAYGHGDVPVSEAALEAVAGHAQGAPERHQEHRDQWPETPTHIAQKVEPAAGSSDGGDGGDVIITAERSVSSLKDFRRQSQGGRAASLLGLMMAGAGGRGSPRHGRIV